MVYLWFTKQLKDMKNEIHLSKATKEISACLDELGSAIANLLELHYDVEIATVRKGMIDKYKELSNDLLKLAEIRIKNMNNAATETN